MKYKFYTLPVLGFLSKSSISSSENTSCGGLLIAIYCDQLHFLFPSIIIKTENSGIRYNPYVDTAKMNVLFA